MAKKDKSINEKIDEFEKALSIDLEIDERKNRVDAIVPEQKAANDDAIGSLRENRQKPKTNIPLISFWVPSIISIVWFSLAYWVSESFLPRAWNQISINDLQNPNTLYILGGLIVPLIIVWAVAINVRRTRELNSVTRIIAEVAQQLRQPDTGPVDAVRTTGQTARIEIETLNNEMEYAIQRANKLESILTQEMIGLNENYDKSEEKLKYFIDKIAEEKEKVLEQGKEIESTINNISSNLHLNMENSRTEINQDINTLQDNFAVALANVNDEIKNSLSIAEESIGGVISVKTDELEDKLNKTTTQFTNELKSTNEKVQDSIENEKNIIENKIIEFENTIYQSSGKITEAIQLNKESIKKDIQQQIHQTSEMIDNKTLDLGILFATKAEEVNQAVTEQIINAEKQMDKVDERVENIKYNIGEQTQGLVTKFDEKSNEVNKLMDQQINTAEQNIGVYLEKYKNVIGKETEQMEKTINEKTSELENHVISAVLSMETQVSMTLENTDNTILNKTEEIANNLNRIAEGDALPLIKDFEMKGLILSEKVAESIKNAGISVSDKLQSTVNETGHKIQMQYDEFEERTTNLNTMLDKLETANVSLATVMDASGANLDAISGMFGQKTAEFSETMQTISDNLAGTSREMDNSYIGMKDTANTVLSEITKISAEFNKESNGLNAVVKFLDETQNNIALNLDDRKNAIEDVTNNLVTQSSQLEGMMERFASALTQSMANAEGHAQNLTAGLADSVNEAVHEATQRFSNATHSMKTIAHEVKYDLAKTRDELKKSMIDLPEETRDATNAMKKVVNEQVRALKDLNIIMNNAAKYQDNTINTMNTMNTMNVENDVEEQNDLGTTSIVENLRQQNSDVQPTSWVSDLLNRASSQDGGSLHSLSAEISNAINQDVIIRLWEQYQNGQREVFSQSMYNPNGMQTYLKVKKRYEDDFRFKQSVDRYIDDFEQMIHDITSKDQSNQTAISYLTSETGKVYTMLAHVTGKFG